MDDANGIVNGPVNSAADLVAGVDPTSIHPVVKTVVGAVYNSPHVEPQHAAAVAASILDGLATYTPAILQVTRADAGTQAWAGIGIGILSSILAAFFPHPKA